MVTMWRKVNLSQVKILLYLQHCTVPNLNGIDMIAVILTGIMMWRAGARVR